MQNLNMQLSMTFEQTARSEGTFHCSILPESYETCNRAAYEAFACAFRDLVAERLRMADYGGATNAEAVEALVAETFGMSTVSYLMSFGPALLPEGSGTYAVADDILTREFSGGESAVTRQERYIRENSTLILFEEIDSEPQGFLSDHYPVMYTLLDY